MRRQHRYRLEPADQCGDDVIKATPPVGLVTNCMAVQVDESVTQTTFFVCLRDTV